MCHKSRPVCGATLTAINDTVAQTGQEEGRAAMSSACKLLGRSAEYFWDGRLAACQWCVMCRDREREREPCGEGRGGGECRSTLITMYSGDG